MDSRPSTVERRWRAMGSSIHVIVVDGSDDVLELAARRIAELEQRWSRFVDTSEVCRLNRAGGQVLTVSTDTTFTVRNRAGS